MSSLKGSGHGLLSVHVHNHCALAEIVDRESMMTNAIGLDVQTHASAES